MSVFDELAKPFKPEEILWRIGRKSKDKTKATVLAYIDSRAIQRRLDEVLGAGNWTVKYTPVDMGTVEKKNNYTGDVSQTPVKGFMCEILIRYQDENGMNNNATKMDGANITDFEPFKGGLSDSFKRTAAAFGIGRYLYDLKETWVPIDQWGNFTPPKLPLWALPEGYVDNNPNYGKEISSPVQSGGETQDVAPSAGSDGLALPRGKYKGILISTLNDKGYLNWLVETSNFPENYKQAARERMQELG